MVQEYLWPALKEAPPMERFLVCKNLKCHFVLDRRINGQSVDGAHHILEKCPACGGLGHPTVCLAVSCWP